MEKIMEPATILNTFREAEYLVRQAREQAMAGDHTAAVLSLKKAIDVYPAYTEAYALLGNCQECIDKLDDAAAAYDKALLLDPGHADAWFNKGMLLKKRGMNREAAQCIEKSMDLYCGW
jgi:tetratricopeptide (TPR) repeat protein